MANNEPIDEGLQLVIPGRREPAGAGWDWIVAGWKLFAKAPVMWIIAMVILFVIAILMNLVPIIGSIAFQLIQAVMAAGLMVACRSLERGEEFELEHIFSGFSRAFVPLVVVGVVLLVGWIVILGVFAMFVGVSVLGVLISADPEAVLSTITASFGAIMLGTLVMMALMVPLLAAYWFAPALVVLNGMSPLAAMKESFFACFRNVIPFFVYSIIMGIALFIAVLPLGLGMLVWMPVAIASTYAAYRGIFTERDSAGAAPTAAPPANPPGYVPP